MVSSTVALAGMAGLTAIQGIGQANALEAQGDYQKAMSEINARNAEIMAERRIKKGDQEAELYGQKVNQAAGSQRTSYAGQGVALDSDTVQEVQKQTYEIGADDIAQLKQNAFLEAMGYKTQAEDIRRQGRMAQNAAKQESFNTLVTTGLKIGQLGMSYFGGPSTTSKAQTLPQKYAGQDYGGKVAR